MFSFAGFSKAFVGFLFFFVGCFVVFLFVCGFYCFLLWSFYVFLGSMTFIFFGHGFLVCSVLRRVFYGFLLWGFLFFVRVSHALFLRVFFFGGGAGCSIAFYCGLCYVFFFFLWRVQDVLCFWNGFQRCIVGLYLCLVGCSIALLLFVVCCCGCCGGGGGGGGAGGAGGVLVGLSMIFVVRRVLILGVAQAAAVGDSSSN